MPRRGLYSQTGAKPALSCILMDIPSTPRRPARTLLFARVFVWCWLSLGAVVCAACDENQTPQDPTPTVPWKKEERPGAKDERPVATYRVTPGQSLQFDLPTRGAKPGGKLGGLAGSLSIDLHKLEASTGKLEVDLRELQITAPPLKPTTKKKATQEDPVAAALAERESLDFRAEALRWLSLGSEVSAEERQRAATATFTIESLRDLSHPNPSAGALLKSQSAGFEVRQVRVDAIGELSWRGLSVHREVPLLLRFQFKSPPSEGEAPRGLEVAIQGNFLVPLSEYGIEPRDEAGHSESEERSLVGQVVGSSARIRGEVTLDRATQ